MMGRTKEVPNGITTDRGREQHAESREAIHLVLELFPMVSMFVYVAVMIKFAAIEYAPSDVDVHRSSRRTTSLR